MNIQKMTAETLKPFIINQTDSDIPVKKQTHPSIWKSVPFLCLTIFVVLFSISITLNVIWNNFRISNEVKKLKDSNDQLKQSLAELKDSIEKLHKRFGYTTLDELEGDYDSGFDDPDGYGVEDEGMDDDNYSDYEDTLDEVINNDNSTKSNGTTLTDDDRLKRSVKIVDESYAIKRNKTNGPPDKIISHLLLNKGINQGKLNYDWKRKNSDSEESHPLYRLNEKKYQEHRSSPISYMPGPQHQQTRSTHNGKDIEKEEDSENIFKDINSKEYSGEQNGITSTSVKPNPSQRQTFNDNHRNHNIPQHPNNRRRNMKPKLKSLQSKRPHHSRIIGAHYIGDTSNYFIGRHENFDGNGRLRHIGGRYTDWVATSWVNGLAMTNHFTFENGVVTVKDEGLYYLYAQIHYHDDHDTNGFIMENNGNSIFQCTTMTHSTQRVTKSNTCHTAGITHLKKDDKISIVDLGHHRFTLFEPAKSFFGLFRLNDMKLPI